MAELFGAKLVGTSCTRHIHFIHGGSGSQAISPTLLPYEPSDDMLSPTVTVILMTLFTWYQIYQEAKENKHKKLPEHYPQVCFKILLSNTYLLVACMLVSIVRKGTDLAAWSFFCALELFLLSLSGALWVCLYPYGFLAAEITFPVSSIISIFLLSLNDKPKLFSRARSKLLRSKLFKSARRVGLFRYNNARCQHVVYSGNPDESLMKGNEFFVVGEQPYAETFGDNAELTIAKRVFHG
uniref:Uncharacterized protein n=1 Tax=Oryza brachyantha TaxID=4533 RepID=J3L4L7_ORYBR